VKKAQEPESRRDHLFISYATEDLQFVEWLTLRLTAEGYKVWCDRIKLLGGESYPRDINAAIKWRTFRLLGVLSRYSINKPNPLKERTFAMNLAKERNENFVVPINLDGLSPTDIGWMASDLTFVPFYLGWADGLKQLLKLLEEANAPRELRDGRSVAASWFEAKHVVVKKQERLWSNLAEVKELPRDMYRYEAASFVPDDDRLELLKRWPHINDGLEFWAFGLPPSEFDAKYKFKEQARRQNWNILRADNPPLRYLAVRLLNESLKSVALARGLKLTPDGKEACYFPDGLVPNNRLSFEEYNQKQTWVSSVGTRNFRTMTGKETCRYHLVPHMKIWLDHELGCVVLVRVHLFVTNPEGQQIEGKAALRRRKRICRSWWNHHWQARTFAMLQFLAGGKSSIQIGEASPQQLVISKYPLTAHIASGIDESQIGLDAPEPEDAEEIVLELDEEGESETEEDQSNE
jgi:hypothetical protein